MGRPGPQDSGDRFVRDLRCSQDEPVGGQRVSSSGCWQSGSPAASGRASPRWPISWSSTGPGWSTPTRSPGRWWPPEGRPTNPSSTASAPRSSRPTGRIDRPKVAALVFGHPEALADLNAITHPAIGMEMIARRDRFADTDDIVVLDIPLLRAVHRQTLDLAAVVVVDAPTELALERLVTPPGDGPGRRPGPHRQPSPTGQSRLEGADLVVDNSGDQDHLRAEVDRVWARAGGPPGPRTTAGPTRPPTGTRPGPGAGPAGTGTIDLVPDFEVVSPFRPAGDQPQAIAGLVEGLRAGRPLPDPPRHHRLGQDRHHRLDHRGGPAAHPDHRAQQVVGRPAGRGAEGVLPPQPGGVLRLLLRLLPARGVRALVGHLHREGLVHQRRDRPPPPRLHLVPPAPAGHHRGGLGLLHLRTGLARRVPRPDRGPATGRGARAAGPAPAAGRAPVLPQRRHPVPGPVPGPGRHRRDPRRLREPGRPHRVLRGHRRADPALRRPDRRDRRRARGAGGLRQHPLRHRGRADAQGRRRASRPSCGSGCPS